jgi:uncharacterized protein (DUF342 family)
MSFRVIFHFGRQAGEKPDPGATIDYHRAYQAVRIKRGQPLAHLEPSDPSVASTSDLMVEKPEDLLSPAVELYKDGSQLLIRSLREGFPVFEGGKITINDFLAIAGDVNFRTGDIDCPGDVVVNGSIMSGFSVRADNLTVTGSIENARVECRGNLICHGGIVACQDHPLICGANLWCKYLENSYIEAGKNIFIAKSSLHSDIRARNNIILCRKDAVLVGGRSEAGNSLYTAILGAKWATPTEIILGCDPFLTRKLAQARAEMAEVEKEIADLQDRIEQINTFLQHEDGGTTPAEAHRLQEERELTENKLGFLETKLSRARQQCGDLEDQVAEFKSTNSDCILQVTTHLFSGVQLTIRDAEKRIDEESEKVVFSNPEAGEEIVPVSEQQ